MQITAIPNRFRQEPIDLVGFDAWQDSEGLTGASDAYREAWTDFRPTWRSIRKQDLARPAVQDFKKTVDVPRELVRCGRAFGLVGVSGNTDLSGAERRAWFRFKKRVLQSDPQVWWLFWAYVGGEPVALTAHRHGVEPRYVLAVSALCCRWWVELWRACCI